MFWGLTINGGKRYNQRVENAFHVSMAALEPDPDLKGGKGAVSLMIQQESTEFLLCTLQHGSLYQQAMDLNFDESEDVTFFLEGTGTMHLTGYLLQEEDDFSEMNMGSSSEDDTDVPSLTPDTPGIAGKRKSLNDLGNAKKKKKEEQASFTTDTSINDYSGFSNMDEEDDSDFDDDDYDDEDEETDDDDDEEEEEEEEEGEMTNSGSKLKEHKESAKKQKQEKKLDFDDSDEDESVDSTGSYTPPLLKLAGSKAGKNKESPGNQLKQKTPISDKKTGKKEKNEQKNADTPTANAGLKGILKNATPQSSQSAKKKKKKNKNENTPTQDTPSSVKVKPDALIKTPGSNVKPGKPQKLAGGITVQDMKVGKGPDARPGKYCHLYYTGRLANNNKTFDSCTQGKPFKFRLGSGEVIKGWDEGIKGMHVGGKRTITVPASQGYGTQNIPGIPPNSTLIFELELKSVS